MGRNQFQVPLPDDDFVGTAKAITSGLEKTDEFSMSLLDGKPYLNISTDEPERVSKILNENGISATTPISWERELFSTLPDPIQGLGESFSESKASFLGISALSFVSPYGLTALTPATILGLGTKVFAPVPKANCESFVWPNKSGTGVGSAYETTLTSSTVSPETVQKAIDEAYNNAIDAAAIALSSLPPIQCDPPCIPVVGIVLGKPTTVAATGPSVTVGGSTTAGGSVDLKPLGVGGGLSGGSSKSVSVSSGSLTTRITAYVTWNVYQRCMKPATPVVGPVPQPDPGADHTIWIGGEPVKVKCPHFSDKGIESGQVERPLLVPMDLAGMQQGAIEEAVKKAENAAKQAIPKLAHCPAGLCSGDLVSVRIGPTSLSTVLVQREMECGLIF